MADEKRTRKEWRRWVRRGIAGAGISASVLTSSPAEAWDPAIALDGGAFFGYRFGGSGAGITFGIEGRLRLDDYISCGSTRGPYGGSVLRLGFDSLFWPQVDLGLLAGTSLSHDVAVGTEAGLGWQFGQHGGFRLWIGAEIAATYAVLRGNVLPLDPGGTVAAGARFPSVGFWQETNCYVTGRPLRTEGSRAAPLPSVHLTGPASPDTSRELAEAVAAIWCGRARTEWASVPAFLDLAAQLSAVRAPPELINRAVAAVSDEVRHALLSARVAARADGGVVHLHPLSLKPRPPLPRNAALVRLALESWLDGCLGEGRAAAFASAEARAAEEPTLADVQQMIARDEAGHAALAWDVIRWALAAGGEEVRTALMAALDTSTPQAFGLRQPDLRSYGVLAEDERRDITEHHHGRAQADLIVLLG